MANSPFGKSSGGGMAVAGEPSRSGGDPFTVPGGGGGEYKFTDFVGELLLVHPVEAGVMATKISPESEFCRVDVVRLANDNEQVDDLLVFGSALIREFKRVLRNGDKWVLGRLGTGQAKNGMNAPYILITPDKDDAGRASKVISELGL